MAVATRQVPATAAVTDRTGIFPGGLLLLGIVTVLVGAWGGIVPFVGPMFGFSADGASSWQWTLPHALLGLVPGAVAVACGLLILAGLRRTALGAGRVDAGLLGFVVSLCGAWFVIGEFAWPVLQGSGYFAGAAPLHYLLEQLAFAIGTGVVLVASGALVMGWAVRHRPVVAGTAYPRAAAAADPVASPTTPDPAAPGVYQAGETASPGSAEHVG
ncbi:MAG: hypothetical protein ACRDY3_14580 [Acidimicrobiales bacterium]